MNSFFRPSVFAALMVAGCAPHKIASLSLHPLPFAMEIPAAILPRLGTGPVEGPFGEQVRQAGATAATTIYYSPLGHGEKVIFMTAYFFPADKFDAAQSPGEPPSYGTEVIRANGNVLSVAGPVDAIFAPDTPDGQNLAALHGVIYLPETYRSQP